MIALAIDTATDRCTVAINAGGEIVEAHIDGARQHAAGILDLVSTVFAKVGAQPSELTHLMTGDGPGSFTGLRVAASVAKALVWKRSVVWSVAPSLLLRAMSAAPAGGGVVLSLSDALRGELYAGCWRIIDTAVVEVGPGISTMVPAALDRFGAVDKVIGSIPEPLLGDVASVTGRHPVSGTAALSDARAFFELAAREGGLSRVTDLHGWQPLYGRPAEAQVVWERKHGRPLPTQTHSIG